MLNKVILIGFVGQDPEIKSASSGSEFAVFNLATSESYKDKETGERKQKTEWHRVVVFSEHLLGVVKSYIKKGSKIYLEGQLGTRKWSDKDTGAEKSLTEVILKQRGKIVLLDRKEREDVPDNAYGEE